MSLAALSVHIAQITPTSHALLSTKADSVVVSEGDGGGVLQKEACARCSHTDSGALSMPQHGARKQRKAWTIRCRNTHAPPINWQLRLLRLLLTIIIIIIKIIKNTDTVCCILLGEVQTTTTTTTTTTTKNRELKTKTQNLQHQQQHKHGGSITVSRGFWLCCSLLPLFPHLWVAGNCPSSPLSSDLINYVYHVLVPRRPCAVDRTLNSNS